MSYCRLNTIYSRMKDRCYNPKNIRYHCYGGRGITICEEWLAPYYGYKNFKKWALSHGYRDDLSIDRIDVNKGYSPDNCRWLTNKEQSNNRRTNYYVTYKGETKTLTQWCEELHLSYGKVWTRLHNLQMPVEEVFAEGKDLRSKMITYCGEVHSVADWCKKLNLNYKTVSARITKHHWTVERAFETKVEK